MLCKKMDGWFLVAVRTGFLLQQSLFNNMKNSYFLKLKLDQIHRTGLYCNPQRRLQENNHWKWAELCGYCELDWLHQKYRRLNITHHTVHKGWSFSQWYESIHHRSTSASTQNRTSIERATHGGHNENSPEVHEKIILNMRWAKF